MSVRRTLAGMTAIAAALSIPATASAQQQCITEAQVSSLVIYAVPLAMNAMQTSCAAELSPDGFLATGAPAMAESYASRSDAAWPNTLSAISVFAGGDEEEGEDRFGAALNEMPEETLRPFVDALVTGMIAGEIKPEQCGNIERLLEALAPLAPEEAARLTVVIASLAGVDEPPICPLED